MIYIQKTYAEAEQLGFPTPWEEYETWEEWSEENSWMLDEMDYRSGIWRIDRDGSMVFVASDGGEPEDNYFNRDWHWVVGELNRAFQNGFDSGYNKGLEEVS